MKVSWQVTGIRRDPWAQANPLVIEQDKSENERDYYLHPEVLEYPVQKNIAVGRYPEEARQFREIKRILSKVTIDKYLHMITSAHKYTDRQTPARRRLAGKDNVKNPLKSFNLCPQVISIRSSHFLILSYFWIFNHR